MTLKTRLRRLEAQHYGRHGATGPTWDDFLAAQERIGQRLAIKRIPVLYDDDDELRRNNWARATLEWGAIALEAWLAGDTPEQVAQDDAVFAEYSRREGHSVEDQREYALMIYLEELEYWNRVADGWGVYGEFEQVIMVQARSGERRAGAEAILARVAAVREFKRQLAATRAAGGEGATADNGN